MYEVEIERQADEGARLRAMIASGQLRTNAGKRIATDEATAAMTAHSILPETTRDQLDQARDRYRRATEQRTAHTQVRVNRVAHEMDPPSLVAHIQARAKR